MCYLDADNQIDECDEDVYGPTIDSKAAIAATMGVWFTDEATVLDYMRKTVETYDDCGATNLTSITLASACEASSVTIVVQDRCQNQATETISIFYDAMNPAIAPLNCPVATLPHTLEMVDIGPLGINTTDNCGIKNVTVRVISDEASATADAKIYQVRNRRPMTRRMMIL